MFLIKNQRITPAQIIILGFILLILIGTILLMLPIATVASGGAPFIDAFFTATSATCVTGLVLHDTAQYWSLFGQIVILLLIQIGGMGVVTMAVSIAMFAGKKIGLRQRFTMQESISAPQVGGIVRLTGFILKTTLLIEGIGALVLAFRFCPQFDFAKGLWYAIFHSVSAFCNAGFDLMGETAPCSSLTNYVADPLINASIMLLIVLGGIGFLTWFDVRAHNWHIRSYRLQSKIIITTTLILILVPVLFFFLYEFGLPQWQDMTLGEKTLAAFFQSVTTRTAGFNTLDLAQFSRLGQLLIMLLMLVGGSPASTAGGYKTTTLAVLFLTAWAVFRRKSSAQCFGRRISDDVLRRAATIFLLYLTLFLSGAMLICAIDNVPLMSALFETASAIGTVGLSLGITSQLGLVSHFILIFLMYFGRVGGLTLIYAVTAHEISEPSQLPQERVTVG